MARLGLLLFFAEVPNMLCAHVHRRILCPINVARLSQKGGGGVVAFYYVSSFFWSTGVDFFFFLLLLLVLIRSAGHTFGAQGNRGFPTSVCREAFFFSLLARGYDRGGRLSLIHI